jgi:hypothetical protein
VLTGGSHGWLAGNQGPPPSLATIVFIPVAGFRHRWIEIDGRPPGTAALIWIRQPGRNRQLWYVLTSAGAHPIGPAPPP